MSSIFHSTLTIISSLVRNIDIRESASTEKVARSKKIYIITELNHIASDKTPKFSGDDFKSLHHGNYALTVITRKPS